MAFQTMMSTTTEMIGMAPGVQPSGVQIAHARTRAHMQIAHARTRMCTHMQIAHARTRTHIRLQQS